MEQNSSLVQRHKLFNARLWCEILIKMNLNYLFIFFYEHIISKLQHPQDPVIQAGYAGNLYIKLSYDNFFFFYKAW